MPETVKVLIPIDIPPFREKVTRQAALLQTCKGFPQNRAFSPWDILESLPCKGVGSKPDEIISAVFGRPEDYIVATEVFHGFVDDAGIQIGEIGTDQDRPGASG